MPTVLEEKPMKRTLISVTVVVAIAIILCIAGKSLAKDTQRIFGGPDYGKDPPKKIVNFLATLSG